MSANGWVSSRSTRAATAAVAGVVALGGVTFAGALHERNGLPAAAHQLLLATSSASAVTSCLQGARDELYVPGVPPLHDAVAVDAARRRLDGCDIRALARALDQVHVPAAAPITDQARRIARDDIVTAADALRRVVLDARGATRLMRANAAGRPDGTAVVLAYRSATSGSDVAYRLTVEALALLGEPQSTVE